MVEIRGQTTCRKMLNSPRCSRQYSRKTPQLPALYTRIMARVNDDHGQRPGEGHAPLGLENALHDKAHKDHVEQAAERIVQEVHPRRQEADAGRDSPADI